MKRLALLLLAVCVGCDKPAAKPTPPVVPAKAGRSSAPPGKGEIRPGVFIPWLEPGRSADDWIRDLREGDDHEQWQARFNLAAMKGDAVPHLVALMRSADAEVRRRGAWALAGMGRHAVLALDVLVAALRDPDPRVAQQAASAFPHMGPDAARCAPALVRALLDGLVDVNAALAMTLVRDLGAAGEEALVGALVEPDLERVLWIFRSLDGNLIGTEDFAVWLLERTLRTHADPAVRRRAVEVLRRLGRDTALADATLVRALLDDADAAVRAACARLLGRLAGDDDDLRETALPALREASKDRDAGVARASANAVQRAEPGGNVRFENDARRKEEEAAILERQGKGDAAVAIYAELLEEHDDDAHAAAWRQALRRLKGTK